MSKAISQTDNYISNVSRYEDAIRSYLKDHERLEIKAVRPGGSSWRVTRARSPFKNNATITDA
jgi:hypothetical protein